MTLNDLKLSSLREIRSRAEINADKVLIVTLEGFARIEQSRLSPMLYRSYILYILSALLM